MAKKPTTIDEYLAAVSDDQRAALQKLRKIIQAAAPLAQECLSYGLAAFRLNGKPLVAFGAGANHCAFYPMNGSTVDAFQDDLKGYVTSKGTIRFPADKLLPAALVRKLVKARIAENEANRAKAPTKARASATAKQAKSAGNSDVASVLDSLKRLATKSTLDGMARYGLPKENAIGVTVGDMKKLAKSLYPNHELALGLWDAGSYEARMLATFVDDPAAVTPAQMDRWCKDFDNWGICDTACFALFDRTPHAWGKVTQWSRKKEEFVKRAAFALLWGLTVHDKEADDEPFMQGLLLVEREAGDERHFVKKAVNMALRAVGKRNPALHAAAVETSRRLAVSPQPAAQWVGKDALRKLSGASVARRLAAKLR